MNIKRLTIESIYPRLWLAWLSPLLWSHTSNCWSLKYDIIIDIFIVPTSFSFSRSANRDRWFKRFGFLFFLTRTNNRRAKADVNYDKFCSRFLHIIHFWKLMIIRGHSCQTSFLFPTFINVTSIVDGLKVVIAYCSYHYFFVNSSSLKHDGISSDDAKGSFSYLGHKYPRIWCPYLHILLKLQLGH